jgi:16S rRNA G966 N2-methylase RsmD
MRVIAGTLKGRRLKTPTWEGLRPTSDKLRETLFNVLGPRVAGARVLDAFAGTGALGIEAISRGAAWVVFLDQDPRAQALVAENLARCGIAAGYAILRATVARGLERLRAAPGFVPFDIVLLDPPYEMYPTRPRRAAHAGAAPRGAAARPRSAEDIATLVARAAAVTARGGLVALEHARRHEPPAAAGPLVLERRLLSGDSALAFYTWQP